MNLKRLLLTILFILTPQLALKAAAQIGSANVTAQAGFSLNSGDVLTIAAQIVGCPSGDVPLYQGVPVSVTPNQTAGSPFTANASQIVSFTVPGNDAILCGGQNYTLYAITWKINGFPAAPTQTYRLADGNTVLLNSLTPVGFYPPNLANAAGFSCPSGTNLQGFDQFFVPKCGASVTTPMPNATASGQLLVSPGVGSNWALLGQIFYQQSGDTISSIEAKCSTACTYYVTSAQSIALAASHTLSSNVSLVFLRGGSWNVSGAFTLTIPGRVEGTPDQHFSGSASIKFGANQSLVPVEWFGAVADANLTGSGTDDTTAIQACLNALSSGQCLLQQGFYKISSALSITRSNIGMKGTTPGGVIFQTSSPVPLSSGLVSNSASADMIDVVGSGATTRIYYNQFRDFSLNRSVAPTGTATGLSINFAGGQVIDNVQVLDSARCFYMHSSPTYGVGRMENYACTWGYGPVTETAGTTLTGIYLDSADGNAQNSLRIRHGLISSTLPSSVTTHGMDVIGTAINDIMVDEFETAAVSIGVNINYTGTGTAGTASDLHFTHNVHDRFFVSGYVINGIPASAFGAVEIAGGYNVSLVATGPLIDIENSAGVSVTGVQIAGSANTFGILARNSNDLIIAQNQIANSPAVDIGFNGTTASVIEGNRIFNLAGSGTEIQMVNSSANAIVANKLGGFAGNGITYDASSNNNTGFGTNLIDFSHITAPFNDATLTNQSIGTGLATLKNSLYPGTPMLQLQQTTATGYTQMQYLGTGRAYNVGVGNASETALGVANKYYIFDNTASILRMTIDQNGLVSFGSAGQFNINSSGNSTIPSINGPATAPSGACTISGSWVFSGDGHVTYCNGGTYVSKI